MKNLLLFLLVLFILSDCKKGDPELSSIDNIVGTWRLVSYGALKDGKRDWTPVPGSPQQTLTFRADGVILDPDSLPTCCAPLKLKVNGAVFDVKPKIQPVNNPKCAYVNCAYCETMEIQQTGDEIIISNCKTTTQSRLVKVP